MSPKKTSEEYGDTLVRLDIPIEEQIDKDRFTKYLAEELGITNLDFQESLWSEVDTSFLMSEHGIKGVTITYPWGVEVRYGIQGLPGLWGLERVREIMEEEEWE
jgi:hypothetical protein